ncbi:MAG: nitroreductase family protein [Burkholderiales bacterium]|nr:nitroreductase family protein [Burkholderiales bacterium]
MSARDVVARVYGDVIAGSEQCVSEAARGEALRLLLTRFSISPKHLGEPGPTDEELSVVALAALRTPDHDKLIPFRFVVARGEGLERLAELFVGYGRRHGKTGEALDTERLRALQAPVVIAVIGRIDDANHRVPRHEQWTTVGGAISNALTALHILGYAGKMLSGLRAADPVIGRAFCREGETLLGWISVGTAKAPAKPRGEIDPALILSEF